MLALCGASSISSWREAPQSRAVPTTAERIDAANTAILAPEKSVAFGNACPAMKSDIVKPMPRVPRRLDGYACAHGRGGREEDAERLSYGEASDDRSHEPPMPNEGARV